MTAFKGLGTYGDGVGVVTPLDHKMAQTGLIVKTSTPMVVRSGLFYLGVTSIVAGAAGMSYSVAAYLCATQRSASAGVVLGGNDGTVSVATTAAPGADARYDVIYHWPREFALDGGDSTPVIGVVQGAASALPAVPSLAAFPGAIELARVLVPAGVTATNSGTTITQTAPFTAVDGSPVPFRNKTAMDLWTTALPNQQATAIDTNIPYYRAGSAWVPVGAGALVQRVTRSAGAATVSSVALTDLSTTANWSTTAPAAQNVGFASYSNGITIPVTGVYRIGFSFSSTSNIGIAAGLTVNVGAGVVAGDLKAAQTSNPAAGLVAITSSEEVSLTAADVVRLFAIAASGTPAVLASRGSFFAEWVRAN